MTNRWVASLLAFTLLTVSKKSEAAQGYAIRIADDADGKISTLQFESKPFPIEVKQMGDDIEAIIDIKIPVTQEDWTFLLGDEALEVKDHSLQFTAKLSKRATQLTLSGIGPNGEIETERITLAVQDYEQFLEKKSNKIKQWFVGGGLSFTSTSLTQTNIPDFSQSSITGRLGVTWLLLPPSWDLSLSAYGTALVLSANRDYSARFIGINARVRYALPFLREPFRLSIMVGGYFANLFVSPSPDFGYKNATGPQIFPTFRYTVKPGQNLVIYGKFSPVLNGLGFLDFTSRELATGISYSLAFHPDLSVGAGFDFSNMSLEIDQTAINVTTWSIGLGINYIF